MPIKRQRKGSGARRARVPAAGWALAIHGGAGSAGEEGLDPVREQAIRAALAAVLQTGATALAAGGTSLDAVETAVCALEDSPWFNAGKGAVFNSHGEHELEASIMTGRDLDAGAVANLRGIKNPVALARLVMERSPHVCLQGEGALAFARSHGVKLVAPDYFWTEDRWRALKAAHAHAGPDRSRPHEHGTVGAVALDLHGDLAAATSTGGMTNKLPGRVGDSSTIGAGTYASNASCAVSCTGHGEYFIRATIARDICALVEYAAHDARSAAQIAIEDRLAELGGRGGAIVVDRDGRIACVFNTDILYRGAVSERLPTRVGVREHDEV